MALTINDIIKCLESVAHPSLQENYDNSGLLVGNPQTQLTNVLVSLDCTEAVIAEAKEKNCNLVVSHHPIIFKGLKKLNGKNYVERTIISAIQNNIAIYAIHTNLDNVLNEGVNSKIAEKLGLENLQILEPKTGSLNKLVTYAPVANAELVRTAMFEAGAGHIGNYDQCSFNVDGSGTFRANNDANPHVGEIGVTHREPETRIEVIFPDYLQKQILNALIKNHPYEEVAYDIYPLNNTWQQTGAGMFGELPTPLSSSDFLKYLKDKMKISVIKYTPFTEQIKKVAICGGAGSFLLNRAKACGADAFVTSDFKYHEFFDAENQIMICDIGHYESEQYTSELIIEIIKRKFPNFAPILTETITNPVNYYY